MRPLLFSLGLATLFIVWAGPLPEMAPRAFFAHMTMHMGVVAIAAPLLALGIAGSRFDPVPHRPGLWAPVPTSVAELVIVWAWHAPGAHHWARHAPWGLVVEQSMFLGAGVFVWLSAFGGGAARGDERTGAGIIGLLLTAMHMTLLGALLALTPRPLYGHSATLFGLSPLEDQHLGGAIMLAVGGLSYLAGGLWLTGRFFAPRDGNRARPESSTRNDPSTLRRPIDA